MATGLLVLAVDRSTKLLGHLALTDKTYHATIRLGQQTDSDDADGLVVVSHPVDGITEADIRAGVAALTGQLMQVPSSVSAIKVQGRRAYDRVRSGETVELAPRPVTVARFEIVSGPRTVDLPMTSALTGQTCQGAAVIDLDVEIDCTTGTYIRSLARDLGAALGVGGHLTRLRRTRVGPFDVSHSVDVFGLDSTVTAQFADDIAVRLIPAASAVQAAFATRAVGSEQVEHLRHGRTIPAVGLAGTYGVLDEEGSLVALATDTGGTARSVLGWLTD